jgi:hypothetical protein
VNVFFWGAGNWTQIHALSKYILYHCVTFPAHGKVIKWSIFMECKQEDLNIRRFSCREGMWKGNESIELKKLPMTKDGFWSFWTIKQCFRLTLISWSNINQVDKDEHYKTYQTRWPRSFGIFSLTIAPLISGAWGEVLPRSSGSMGF